MKVISCQRSVVSCLRSIVCVGIIFIFLFSFFNSATAQTAVGHWRDCLDYSWVNHVAHAGDRIYAGARDGVFCYDFDDNTLTRLCKGNGLSDVGIAALDYDPVTKCLVVAYNNSNVDRRAYLATGFGVVVVNIDRQEIKETWYLGAGGAYTPVYDLAFLSDSIYAATGEGLKRLSRDETHPAISDRWNIDHRLDGKNVFEMATVGSHLLAACHTYMPDVDDIYHKTGTGFVKIYSGELKSLHAGGGYLAISADGEVKMMPR